MSMFVVFFDLYVVVGLALTMFIYTGIYKDNLSIVFDDDEDEETVQHVREQFEKHFVTSALSWTLFWPFKLATPV